MNIALTGRTSVRAYVGHTFFFVVFFSSKTSHNLSTPRANLNYLVSPRTIFMGAKSFIETKEMQRIFVLNDKLIYTMKNCMVSMATVHMFLKHGDVQKSYKIDHIFTVTYFILLNMVSF